MWLWPAVLGPALYVAVTLVTAVLTDPISTGWESFSESILWMSAFLAVALSPWARERNRQLAIGVVGVAIAVGLYCVLPLRGRPRRRPRRTLRGRRCPGFRARSRCASSAAS